MKHPITVHGNVGSMRPLEYRRGDAIGRYTVVELLGAGGMGEVYAAHDPELARGIALKVIRHAPGDAHGPLDRARVLREAQALARLSHPNVVTVYDAGSTDHDVFIAMERLEGVTLARWLKERRPSWREIVDVFVAAGRGIEAAHAVGIVHRDFKPHNVMVSDKRVVVLDFGLARHHDEPESNDHRPPPPALAVSITRTGAVVGTPAYMSPEQLEGRPATARSDQWSFCASLYEALYRERPFRGASLDEIFASAHAGEPRPPPRVKLPRWLVALIFRGLRADPAERHASMTVLLAALSRDRRRRLRVGLAIAAVGGALAAVALWRSPPATDPCAGAAAALGGVWDPPAHAAVRAAFASIHRPFADDSAARTEAAIDAYAGSWIEMRGAACAATVVRGEQSPALMDLRMACLDRRRGELAAFVRSLSDGLDPDGAGTAVQRAARLGPLAACADARALGERVPLPDDDAVRAHVIALQDRLAVVEDAIASKRRPFPARHEGVIAAAMASPHAPLRARGLLAKARERALAVDLDPVTGLLERALRAAVEGRDDAELATVWIALVNANMVRSRFDEAVALGLTARTAVTRAGDDPQMVVDLESALGAALATLDRFAEAEPHFEKALAAARSMGDRGLPALATALIGRLQAIVSLGDLPRARRAAAEYLEVAERAYGPRHVATGNGHNIMAIVEKDSGRLEEAIAEYRRAHDIFVETQGAESRNALYVDYNVAVVENQRRRWSEALAVLQRVIPAVERVAPEDQYLSAMYIALGNSYVNLGRADDARAALERARTAMARLPADHHRFAHLALIHSDLAVLEGRWKEAVAYARDGLAISEHKFGPDSAFNVAALIDVAQAERGAGRPGVALELLDRALRIARAQRTGPAEEAEVRWETALSLAAGRREPVRARAMAAAAQALFVVADDDRAVGVGRWIGKR